MSTLGDPDLDLAMNEFNDRSEAFLETLQPMAFSSDEEESMTDPVSENQPQLTTINQQGGMSDPTGSMSRGESLSSDRRSSDQSNRETVAAVSKPIRILSQPRAHFHPRTANERKRAAHYIRCEKGAVSEYPTVDTDPAWKLQSDKNYIRVSLLGIDGQPHPYPIDKKKEENSSDAELPLSLQNSNPRSLWFSVTDRDFDEKKKLFLIEQIKSKQENGIDKALIAKRQLEKSKLRFTRFYHLGNGEYQEDSGSTVLSIVMCEDRGTFDIMDVFPLHGPMSRVQKVCIETKGPLPKELKGTFLVRLHGKQITDIKDLKRKNNSTTFFMPKCDVPDVDVFGVDLAVEYDHEEIYRTTYVYSKGLEADLNRLASNEIPTNDQQMQTASTPSSSIPSQRSKQDAKRKRT